MTVTPPGPGWDNNPGPYNQGPGSSPPPPNQPPYGGGYGNGGYDPNRNNGKSWLVPSIIAGILVLLLLVGVAVFFLTRGEDAPPPSPTPVPDVSTSQAAPPAPAPEVTTPPAPAPDVTTPPAEDPGNGDAPQRAGADETKFFAGLMIPPHDQYWSDKSKAAALKLGYAICSAYDQGASPQQIIAAMTNEGIPRAEANWVRAAAVVYLCPEHRSSQVA